MDAEGLFFASLLAEGGDIGNLRGVDREHLAEHFQPVYDYIIEFIREESRLPRFDTLDSRFPRLLPRNAPEDPGFYAKAIRENAMRLDLEDGLQEHVVAPLSEQRATTALAGARQVITDVSERFRTWGDGTVLDDISVGVRARMADYQLRKLARGATGLPTPWRTLTIATGGIQTTDAVALLARPNMGKAASVDSKVLTPRGWSRMGDLKVGDALASVDGQRSTVTAVHPQGVRRLYCVTFSDGRSAEVCDEHLWKVYYRGWDEPRVIQTSKLSDMLLRKRYQKRLWIDLFCGEFGGADLPVHPWVMGVLLGDGCFRGKNPMVSNGDADIVARLGALLSEDGLGLNHYSDTDYGISDRVSTSNRLKDALLGFGLWKCYSHEKWIPEDYMAADRESRMNLLAGILDSDGTVSRGGSVQITLTSGRMIQDVVTLVRSLGGWASYRERARPHYTYKGVKRDGRRAWCCGISLPGLAPYLVSRHKVARVVLVKRFRRLTVSSVVPVHSAETQCISVSHPSRLYVMDDFVVTHNTWALVLWAVYLWQKRFRVLFVSMESPPAARRPRDRRHKVIGRMCLRCYQADVPSEEECPAADIARQRLSVRFDALGARLSAWRLYKGWLTPQEEERLGRYYRACATKNDGKWGDLKIVAAPYVANIGDLEMEILQFQPDVVFWDSAYLAAMPTRDRGENRWAVLCRSFKLMLERVGIPGVVSWHFNRDVDAKATNADMGSGALTDELPRVFDTILGMFRPPEMEEAGECGWRGLKTRDGVKMGAMRTNFEIREHIDFSEIGE